MDLVFGVYLKIVLHTLFTVVFCPMSMYVFLPTNIDTVLLSALLQLYA